MRKNKLKELFKEGKPIINSWLAVPSSFSAETMANQGWDSLTIDMQHGLIDYPNAVSMLQAISTTTTTPMARVNWNEPGQIMKILDAGCYGVICPMVSNRKEAENFVQACQYPPKGASATATTGVFTATQPDSSCSDALLAFFKSVV